MNKKNYLKIYLLVFAAIFFQLSTSCSNPFFIKETKLYKVTFSTNGGSTISAVRTDCIKTMPVTKRQDYNFLNWHLKSDFSDEAVSFPLKITQDTTLYAKWQAQYTVIFECNGGDEIESCKTGIIETLPDTNRTNCIFAGWFTKSDFSNEPVTFPFIVTKPTTLYAKWIPTYEVRFIANGGSEIVSFRTAEMKTSPETIREGYSFVGWFSDINLTNEISFPFSLTADITLYAKWQQVFSVVFVTNGGTPLDVQKTGYITTSPVTTKNDFTFAGWYLDTDLSEENKITFPFTVTNDITLYAKWKPLQCTITYMPNGATKGIVPESIIVDKGSQYTIVGNSGNLEKTDYAFTKWNTKADGNGQGYSAGDKITVTGDIILYAQWGKDYAAMITVPDGWFYFGSPETVNRPKITLSSFQIAKYELTYELWLEVYTWAKVNGYNLTVASKGYAINDQYKSFVPASNISWNMACVWLNAYSEFKGYEPVYYRGSSVWRDDTNTNNSFHWIQTNNGFRLPTECEWEFAAGGGNAKNHDDYTYSGSNTVEDVAWNYNYYSEKEMHSVGTKKSNTLGIYDMSGNALEFCFDEYSNYGSGELTNPIHSSGEYQKRVFRGGCFYYPASSSISYRLVFDIAPAISAKDYKEEYIGLRIARNAE